MPLNFVILYGSVRPERQGIRVARFIDGQIRGRGHSTTLIDPMIYRLPLLERMYKEYKGAAPAPLEELAGLYRKADGFVIVSGEYNHGIPPALKNLLDHFLEEYFWRPSAIVCYSAGMFGGVRAAMQLRATLSELGMPSIPSLLPFGRVGTTFTEDGVLQDPSAFASATARFLSELEWYARAFQAERAKGTPY
ncbi:NADPH-dependent FMN reductase [Beijerinckiaceae bacterium]|jgi:NAD(P)H-dependent FMN reductase|nr:NADPH-dependent FMN reductase [Beijerinckiaceae bacterium]